MGTILSGRASFHARRSHDLRTPAPGSSPGFAARHSASYRSMLRLICAARSLNLPTYGASWATSPVAGSRVNPAEASAALTSVGLGPWLAAQAAGLDTELGSGGLTVSGGERRRLLLARVALHPAPIHLIDEGAEHLDPAGADALRALVRRRSAARRSTILVTHDPSLLDVVDTVIDLGTETEEP